VRFSTRNIVIALITAAVGLAIGLLAGTLMSGSHNTEPAQDKQLNLEEVRALAELKTPDGTELLAGWFTDRQGWQLSARMRVPRAQLENLLRDNGFGTPESGSGAEFRNAASELDRDWKPGGASRVEIVKEQQAPGKPGTLRSLLLQQDDPAVMIVYLLARG